MAVEQGPPRAGYELTEKAVALLSIVEEMRSFGHDWLIADDLDHWREHLSARGELRLLAF